MKKNTTQQEVLLNRNARFAQRQWAERDPKESENLTGIERLEKACWDGLVKEIIPELDITLAAPKKLWLWQVQATHSFLALDFYETPGPKENESSINPCIFFDYVWEN